MFIERLKITTGDLVIRDIEFHVGLNLIVDETPSDDLRLTGNNVGKTTVLKLVDFCLGANPKIIYTDPEDQRATYELVHDFLCDREVLVTLTLTDKIGSKVAKTVVVERNFLKRNRVVRRINGVQVADKSFLTDLGKELLPSLLEGGKPSFRQVIGHNIRYEPYVMENTLKTLGPYGKNVEYEALYLFLLGVPHLRANQKQELAAKRKAEAGYLKRLLNGHSISDYQAVLAQTEREIAGLEEKRWDLSLRSDYLAKLEELDVEKFEASKISSLIAQIDLRIAVIEEARHELMSGVSKVNLEELRSLYEDARVFVPELHRAFEELVEFHNTMIFERIEFITQDLPKLRVRLSELHSAMESHVRRSKELSEELALLPTSEQIDALVGTLGEKMRQKGEYEARITQIDDVNDRIADLDRDIKKCEEDIYSAEHEHLVRKRVESFNDKFSQISQALYGETYMLGVDIKTDKSGTRYYDFHMLDLNNFSAGKKQGEVIAFDLAYTMFADELKIDCLHFLLNDRKELMHGNQLQKLSQLAADSNCQIVIAILQDKLPPEIDLVNKVILSLSQEDKLFRIEELS